MKIKEIPNDNRPRERFLKYGPTTLSDAELFAIILRTGTKNKNVIDVSNSLISKYGIDKLFDCSIKELKEIEGIGTNKAMQILAISELQKRVIMSKRDIKKISCAEDVFNYFHEKLRNEKQEHFYTLILNTQNMIIKEELITTGVLDAAIVHPREIFRPAIKNAASKIVLVHNHPSGNPTPSPEDLEITRKIIEIGKEIDIRVIDHVIIGNEDWWSWVEKGKDF
jgi:DNA repair protein RadC